MKFRTTLFLLNFITFAYTGLNEVFEDFLSKPQYQLYFSAEKWGPKALKTKEENGNTIIKLPVNKDGLTYACEIEKPVEVPKVTSEEDNKKMMISKALEKLEAMSNGPCITYIQDWWSYEFCYKKYLTQFHEAKPTDPPEHNMHFYLGKYPTQEQLENPDFEYKKESYKRDPFGKNYLTQMLVDGSMCDVTGKPRQAELRFYCGENENILSIKETTTCNYVVVINTPKLCNSPGFESKKSINSILCHPISDRDEEEEISNEQPDNLPFPVFRRQRSMAEIERSKENPKKIYKRKHKKRPGVTFIDKIGKDNEDDNNDDEIDDEKIKEANEKREAIKKSLEEQLEKKRNDLLDALLPFANELRDVDDKVVDDVLNQLADSLADAIDDDSDEDGKTKVADVDFEVVTKEKLKSWLEKHEDKLSSSDDMKFEVILLDKNGRRYEVSNSDTDVEKIMDFLKEYSSDGNDFQDMPNLKDKIAKKLEELEEINTKEKKQEINKIKKEEEEKNKRDEL